MVDDEIEESCSFCGVAKTELADDESFEDFSGRPMCGACHEERTRDDAICNLSMDWELTDILADISTEIGKLKRALRDKS